MLVEPTDYLSREQLEQLRRIDPLRSLGAVAWTWGWIIGCFALYAVSPSALSVAIAWVVMSGRHLALAILLHESAHGLLLRNKPWNDGIGQWLTAYPTQGDTLLYRRAHFQHHKHTWTEKDPDLGLATALPVSARASAQDLPDLSVPEHSSATGSSRVTPPASRHWQRPRRQVMLGLGTFARNPRLLVTNDLSSANVARIPEAYLLI